jgi:hypothetical protein
MRRLVRRLDRWIARVAMASKCRRHCTSLSIRCRTYAIASDCLHAVDAHLALKIISRWPRITLWDKGILLDYATRDRVPQACSTKCRSTTASKHDGVAY